MTYLAGTVDGVGAKLATRDYRGDGPPLVLMHGAGMDQASLAPVAELLSPRFRVVTFDFRGHGATDRVDWSFASSVQDVEAVAKSYGLGVPAVGGHSLGGMVGVHYGLLHPDCPGVINIDGQGRGRVEQYVGIPEPDVRAWWDDHQRKVERVLNGPVGLGVRGLSAVLRRPPVASREAALQVMAEVDALDLISTYEQLHCPLLVFNAVAPQQAKGLMKLVMGKGAPLVTAFRAGLARDLAALAEKQANVEVVEVDATHMLIRTHPELVARHIASFLG